MDRNTRLFRLEVYIPLKYYTVVAASSIEEAVEKSKQQGFYPDFNVLSPEELSRDAWIVDDYNDNHHHIDTIPTREYKVIDISNNDLPK